MVGIVACVARAHDVDNTIVERLLRIELRHIDTNTLIHFALAHPGPTGRAKCRKSSASAFSKVKWRARLGVNRKNDTIWMMKSKIKGGKSPTRASCKYYSLDLEVLNEAANECTQYFLRGILVISKVPAHGQPFVANHGWI